MTNAERAADFDVLEIREGLTRYQGASPLGPVTVTQRAKKTTAPLRSVVPTTPRGRGNSQISEAVRQKAYAARLKGITLRVVAKRLGMSISSAHRFAQGQKDV